MRGRTRPHKGGTCSIDPPLQPPPPATLPLPRLPSSLTFWIIFVIFSDAEFLIDGMLLTESHFFDRLGYWRCFFFFIIIFLSERDEKKAFAQFSVTNISERISFLPLPPSREFADRAILRDSIRCFCWQISEPIGSDQKGASSVSRGRRSRGVKENSPSEEFIVHHFFLVRACGKVICMIR